MTTTEITDLPGLGAIRDRAATALAEDVPGLLAAIDFVLGRHSEGYFQSITRCIRHASLRLPPPDCENCQVVEYTSCAVCQDKERDRPARFADCEYRTAMSEAIFAAREHG